MHQHGIGLTLEGSCNYHSHLQLWWQCHNWSTTFSIINNRRWLHMKSWLLNEVMRRLQKYPQFEINNSWHHLKVITLKMICNDFLVVKVNCWSYVFNIIKSIWILRNIKNQKIVELASTLRWFTAGVQSASLYDNFCKHGNYVIMTSMMTS